MPAAFSAQQVPALIQDRLSRLSMMLGCRSADDGRINRVNSQQFIEIATDSGSRPDFRLQFQGCWRVSVEQRHDFTSAVGDQLFAVMFSHPAAAKDCKSQFVHECVAD